MTTSLPSKGPEALDFKSATLYAVRLVLHSNDLDALLAALDQRMHDAGAFFEDEPVVLDASGLTQPIEWNRLLEAIRGHRLHPVGVVAQGEVLDSALDSGLNEVDLSNAPTRPSTKPASEADVPTLHNKANLKTPSHTQEASLSANTTDRLAKESASVETPLAQKSEAPNTFTVAPAALVINRQLRSGQRVYARDTDLVIIGAVGQGAEVIADGNIHVYGPLRGKAMAGARGDATARIFTTELDPELIAIAGVYRVIDEDLDSSVHKQTTVIQLEADNLSIRTLS